MEIIEELVKFYDLSFREIERLLSYFAILQNMIFKSTFIPYYQNIIAFVCLLKVRNHELLNSLDSISYEKLVSECNLSPFENNTSNYVLYSLVKYLKFDLSDDETRNQILKDKEVHIASHGRLPKNILTKVNTWFSDISQNN